MRSARNVCTGLLLSLIALIPVASASAADPAPAWSGLSVSLPTNFVPGDKKHDYRYEVEFVNVGAAATEPGALTLVDTLPPGLKVKSTQLLARKRAPQGFFLEQDLHTSCKSSKSGSSVVLTCALTEEALDSAFPTVPQPSVVEPQERLMLIVHVSVAAGTEGLLRNVAQISGGGVEPASAESSGEASEFPAPPGLADFQATALGPDGLPVRQAGSRPYAYRIRFALNTEFAPGAEQFVIPTGGDVKEIETRLPPGLIGNPTAAARCTPEEFGTAHGFEAGFGNNSFKTDCPQGSAIGTAVARVEGRGATASVGDGLYDLVPPTGMPAQFGFGSPILPLYINTRVRSDSDYGVTAYLHNVSEAARIVFSEVVIWGNPGAAVHDPLRGTCATGEAPACSPGIPPPPPFLRLPTSCAGGLTTELVTANWLHQGDFLTTLSPGPAPTGCDQVPFTPSIETRPTTNVADAPTGLHFDLHIPQATHEDPEGLAEADLKGARIVLPEGLRVNPASADDLTGCSAAEVGLTSATGELPARFTGETPACPDASKLGTVSVRTPLVDHSLPGAVYLATPHENPFGSLLAIYITIADPESGVVVKLPAKVEADPVTGRLTATVDDNPQLPFEDFELDFFKGSRAPLRTPTTCGGFATSSSLTPYSAPESGPSATPGDSFPISASPGGGSCPTALTQAPHSPRFEAGTATPVAGAFSPFTMRLTRSDGSQELEGLKLSLPPGLLAKIAGVAECPDGALAAAAGRSGAAEQASPSCPAGSRIGTATVGTGAGPAPFYVKGAAYLAGPYKGAPLSVAILTPAVAGPFDLGTVVVRAALQIDPETAQVTVESDPFPTILEGIPLDIRSIDVKLDRDSFTVNPTSCRKMAIAGEATSTLGQAAPLHSGFQVGDCAELPFKPKLGLRLKGSGARTGHPALTATLTMPPGSAGIARAQVSLPHSEFLDQGHIGTICTRVQFAARQCPAASIYGKAKALSPLLGEPLEGPVYLRSSDHELPDLVADLDGRIHVLLHGRIDSFKGGIRTTFEGVPDAPVSSFVLAMRGGKKGLLQNSINICGRPKRARAAFLAQSGRSLSLRPKLRIACGKHAHRGKRHKGKGRK